LDAQDLTGEKMVTEIMDGDLGRDKKFSDDGNDSKILQLHLAEYQMLTTRNTYWITIQMSLWPVLLLVLALVAQVRDLFLPGLLAWVSVAIIQVIIFWYYVLLLEQYRNVLYIEQYLRAQISALIGPRQFWFYETFLKRLRGHQPFVWEYSPLAISLCAILFGVSARMSIRSFSDYLGLALNCVGIMLSFKQALAASRIRTDWSQVMHEAGESGQSEASSGRLSPRA
jgi:hypothetical protein